MNTLFHFRLFVIINIAIINSAAKIRLFFEPATLLTKNIRLERERVRLLSLKLPNAIVKASPLSLFFLVVCDRNIYKNGYWAKIIIRNNS